MYRMAEEANEEKKCLEENYEIDKIDGFPRVIFLKNNESNSSLIHSTPKYNAS